MSNPNLLPNNEPENTCPVMQRRAWMMAGLSAALGAALPGAAWASSEARVIPPFAPKDKPAAVQSSPEVAVLAGGCFWGVQGVYQHVRGVANAVSGYAGGDKSTAVYRIVGSGMTGHAEAVQITFDPREVSFADLLQIYFSVAHDPTQLNRQGPDTGSQYRSAIFPVNAEQTATAKAYIAQLNQARVFNSAIVTKIEVGRIFFPAEGYHQDFLTKNPTHPYIVVNDLPKVEDLKRLFATRYRAEPALVSGSRKTG